MGVVRDKYPNALNGPMKFGIGDMDLGDNSYHVIDMFGTAWCDAEGKIMIDEEPSKLEYMCSDCLNCLDDEEPIRVHLNCLDDEEPKHKPATRRR